MGLDMTMYLECETGNKENPTEKIYIFSKGITHNLARMATEANLYVPIWLADGHKAKDVLPELESGYVSLCSEKKQLKKQFTPKNGFGSWEVLEEFVREMIETCKKYPNAVIEVDK